MMHFADFMDIVECRFVWFPEYSNIKEEQILYLRYFNKIFGTMDFLTQNTHMLTYMKHFIFCAINVWTNM